ncbi:hypothetical protein QBC43DRAFT_7146 [Cladorrhinum sp. PSN259]|nr:hypothetical protein QBC43DRAFT_7146 [Cladorrhinum sp. PSN259]
MARHLGGCYFVFLYSEDEVFFYLTGMAVIAQRHIPNPLHGMRLHLAAQASILCCFICFVFIWRDNACP